MKKYTSLSFALLLICTSIIFFACKKDLSRENELIPDKGADLTTKINTSLSGFVTNENDAPVQGATVTAGLKTATTNQYGYFEIKNTSLIQTAAVVTIVKAGYFNGIKTYAVTANKNNFFRVKLIPKNISGSFSAASGGSVSLPSGLIVALPANAVVNASTNAAYTGTVNVSSFFIDPLAADLSLILPGDQRALDNNGQIKGLTTYGMAAVELRGAAGEKLQVAAGKKATLTFPLSGNVLAGAAASIPLWYLDETSGLWKEEGSAVKTGNTYVGEVSHFTYWNCDLPNAIVPLTFTVVNAAGDPIGNVHVEITPTTPNSWSHIGGNTDPTGYVSVFVTPNASYLLTITSYSCTSSVYTQTFSVGTSPVNLGNIVIGSNSNLYTLNGNVTDCNNNALPNAIVFVQTGFYYSSFPVSANGTFNVTYFSCNTLPISLIAQNLNTLDQSPVITQTVTPGVNNIGTLQACGSTTTEFVQYNFNSVTHSFIAPQNYIYHYGSGSGSVISSYAQNDQFNLYYDHSGIAQGSAQPLTGFRLGASVDSLAAPGALVNITEYGNVGQYISGNFAIVAHKVSNPSLTYNITCNFRVKRNY